MSLFLILTSLAIVLLLIFAFTNGFQDASSIVATAIASGAVTPRGAVTNIAAGCVVGTLISGSAVSNTIQGLVSIDSEEVLLGVIMAAVIASSLWNLVTWRYGIPSSSTHAIVGGLVGAGLFATGPDDIFWGFAELTDWRLVGLTKVLVFLFVSVAFGFFGGFFLQKLSETALRGADRSVNHPIKRSQLLTVTILGISNGANDSQKQMGLISVALFAGGYATTLDIPIWVRLSVGVVMALGILGGGWRIMRTVGRGIYPLEPVHSLNSQIASGASVLWSTLSGAPVSSTQVVSSSVIGIGSAENVKKVRWKVGKEIMISWIITIPVTMAVSGVVYMVIDWMI
jgi:PiT family inorganic phosphate transporter